MATLYETLTDAQNGEAMAAVGREFAAAPPGKDRDPDKKDSGKMHICLHKQVMITC
jgi:hypothetical protein